MTFPLFYPFVGDKRKYVKIINIYGFPFPCFLRCIPWRRNSVYLLSGVLKGLGDLEKAVKGFRRTNW